MPATRTTRQIVESNTAAAPDGAADGHERAKDFLTEGEVARLLDAARGGRHGIRDHLLLLMMFRHGLRVSEAVGLRRDELDLDRARLWVRRLKAAAARIWSQLAAVRCKEARRGRPVAHTRGGLE